MKEPPICGALKSRMGANRRRKTIKNTSSQLTACLIDPYRSKFRIRFEQNPQLVVI